MVDGIIGNSVALIICVTNEVILICGPNSRSIVKPIRRSNHSNDSLIVGL